MKLILQISDFKQLQLSTVGAKQETILGEPDMTVVVECIDFMDSKLFEVPITIAKHLEDLFTNSTHLSVVLRVK